MGSKEIDIQEMIDVMQSITSYKNLANMFGQLDPRQNETIKPWWEDVLKQYGDKGQYIGPELYRVWVDVNVYIIQQLWSNTAGGWQGIGGSAMTSAYTTIIENSQTKSVWVYYSGRLAYTAVMDDKYAEYKASGYRNMPGVQDCGKVLQIIYKKQ